MKLETLMKRLTTCLLALTCLLGTNLFAQMNSTNTTLVAYFSATGTTRGVAEKIAAVAGADLCEIVPAVRYTNADLDWRNDRSRSSIEMADKKSRPAMQPVKIDMQAYDTVYLGFPVWWDVAPRIINTFIETCSLQGKTVILFATSGSSTITNSLATLRKTYPDLNITGGKLLNNATEKTIRRWLGK